MDRVAFQNKFKQSTQTDDTHRHTQNHFHSFTHIHTLRCTSFLLPGVWSHAGPLSESCTLVKVRKMDRRQRKSSVREPRNMEVVGIEKASQSGEMEVDEGGTGLVCQV